MAKRDFKLIVLGILCGAMIGTLLGNVLMFLLPDSAVKDFFLTSLSIDVGGLAGNEMGVIVLDLKIITFKFGLAMSLNFTSVIGLTVAYYILRYFR